VVSKSYSTSSGSIGILDRFTNQESSSSVGNLDHDGRVVLGGSLKTCISGGRTVVENDMVCEFRLADVQKHIYSVRN